MIGTRNVLARINEMCNMDQGLEITKYSFTQEKREKKRDNKAKYSLICFCYSLHELGAHARVNFEKSRTKGKKKNNKQGTTNESEEQI